MNKSRMKFGALLAVMLIVSMALVPAVSAVQPATSDKDNKPPQHGITTDEAVNEHVPPKIPEHIVPSVVIPAKDHKMPVFREVVIVYFKEMPVSLNKFASKNGGKLVFVNEDIKMAAFETKSIGKPAHTSRVTSDFINKTSKDSRVENAHKDGFVFIRPNKEYLPEPKIVSPEDYEKEGWEYVPNEIIVGFWRMPASLEEFASKYGVTIKGVTNGLLSATFETNNASEFVKMMSADSYVRYAEPNGIEYAATTDPDWDKQWGPTSIYAPEAWVSQKGSTSVLVAIVDSGIDYNHEDLSERVILGHDYHNNDLDPMDDNSHGTHVAGIVGAVMDNNTGIAGVAQVNLLAVKVTGNKTNPNGTTANLADGINYSADNGAKIISISIGSFNNATKKIDACDYAYNVKGSLLIASSGNDGIEQVSYPAAYDTVIAVGAINSNDQRRSSSNYGTQLELVAPGTNIYSTIPNNGYTNKSGTSMAAPHVSGVAALIWSQNPTYDNVKVREVLRETAIDLGTSGRDNETGYGKVNAYAAVTKGKLLSTKTGWLSGTGQSYTYTVSVPAPSYVTVVMAGNENADFDLYAKKGSAPTTTNYDEKSNSITSLEYFPIYVNGPETLHIMVHSHSGSGNRKSWVISGSYEGGVKNTGYLGSGASGHYSYVGNGTGYAINSGPDGSDFDTYIKWNSQPATDDYDARGYTGWPQDIAGPAVGAGTEHYMVHAYTGTGGYAATTMIY